MKTINIIGSCCSKNIFNFAPIKKEFIVKKFAFQNNIWSCFDEPLGIADEAIAKLDLAPINKNIIRYELNKVTIPEFESEKSDIFMIDMMMLSFPVYKVTYNSISTYTQNNNLGAAVLPKLRGLDEFAGLEIEKMDLSDIPEDQIKKGLDTFCDWVLSQYSPDRIILFCPRNASQYMLASDNSVHDYSEEEKSKTTAQNFLVKRYSDYLWSKLGDIIFYEDSEDNIAYFASSKDRKPAPYYLTDDAYIRQGTELLDLIPPEVMSAPAIAEEEVDDKDTEVVSEAPEEETKSLLEDGLSDAELADLKKKKTLQKITVNVFKWILFGILALRLVTKVASFVRPLL